jgi:hypothetical protein
MFWAIRLVPKKTFPSQQGDKKKEKTGSFQ